MESPPNETEVIPMFDMDIFTDSLEPFVESSYQPLLEPSLNHELADQSTSVLVSAMDSEIENPGLDETTFDLSFQPTSNSTFNHGLQSTFKCLLCERIILEKFLATHLSNCASPEIAACPSVEISTPVSVPESE